MSDQYFDTLASNLACASTSGKKKQGTFNKELFYTEVKEQISIL